MNDLKELGTMMIDPGFLVYTAIALSISLGLIIKVAPKYGQTNVLVYIVICSLLGSFSVACVKGKFFKIMIALKFMVFSGVGLVIKQFFSTDAENPFKVPLTYFLIACLVMSGIQLFHVLMALLDVFTNIWAGTVNRPDLRNN